MNKIVLSSLLLLAACSDQEEPRQPAPSEPFLAVNTAPVAMRPIASGITVSGIIEPREEASVGAELSGYKVLSVLADQGDYVRSGEPLAVLDGALIEGEITRAEVAAERARSEYARVADLAGKGVIAEETIAQRQFETRAAEAQLRDLRTRRNRLTLRAPVSGLVLARALRPGDISGGGASDPYFRIARDGRFELVADVPEAELAKVQIGQQVTVELPDGSSLTGTVRLIAPRIDPQTKLGQLRVLLPSDRRIKSGGFATARLTQDGSAASAVPERAVLYQAGGAVVLTVASDNRVRRVPVRTGARAKGWVELREGPPVGTRVILDGGALVLPGDKVRAVGALR